MLKTEEFALRHYLSDFPQAKTYQEVLKMVEEYTEEDFKVYNQIIIWQPFEHRSGVDMAQLIDDMKDNLEITFGKQ